MRLTRCDSLTKMIQTLYLSNGILNHPGHKLQWCSTDFCSNQLTKRSVWFECYLQSGDLNARQTSPSLTEGRVRFLRFQLSTRSGNCFGRHHKYLHSNVSLSAYEIKFPRTRNFPKLCDP